MSQRRPRLTGGGRKRCLLRQNRALKPLKLGRRLDPDLVDESPSCLAVGGECVGLPSCAIEREQFLQAPQTFAQWLLRHKRLELRNDRRVASELEVELDPGLERRQAQLLEPADGCLDEGLVLEIRKRGPAPERKRLAQQRRRFVSPSFALCCCGQPLEPRQIE